MSNASTTILVSFNVLGMVPDYGSIKLEHVAYFILYFKLCVTYVKKSIIDNSKGIHYPAYICT